MQDNTRESGSLIRFHPAATHFAREADSRTDERLTFVAELQRGLMGAATEGEVADVVVELMVAKTGAECCRMDRVEDASTARTRTLSVRSVAGLVPDIDKDISQWVVRTGMLVRYGRAEPASGDTRVQSLISLPVRVREQAVAVVTLTSGDRSVFSEYDEEKLNQATALIGDALDRVRRSEEIFDQARREREDELTACKQRLVHSERLSSVGGLLAGIVHELNSPLTAILGFAQLMQDANGSCPAVDKIVTESERCARIVQNVLRVSGASVPGEREPIDVNAGIRQAVELVSFQLKLSRIHMDVDLSQVSPRIHANACEFVQVLLNLLTNAVQAIGGDERGSDRSGDPGGDIGIRSRVEDGQVAIIVYDDGPGIAPEKIDHVFEPFYTTKRTGTGLGLSLSKQLVEDNDGAIDVRSRPGKGTTFTLRFPVLPADQTVEARPTRILVVDDESRILELMEAVLTRPGFEVRCVEFAEQAVKELSAGDYDLLITDMRMPGMDGTELVHWAQRNRTVDHVLLLTGDIASRDLNRIARELGAECLHKPFRIEELQAAVDHVLRGEAEPARTD